MDRGNTKEKTQQPHTYESTNRINSVCMIRSIEWPNVRPYSPRPTPGPPRSMSPVNLIYAYTYSNQIIEMHPIQLPNAKAHMGYRTKRSSAPSLHPHAHTYNNPLLTLARVAGMIRSVSATSTTGVRRRVLLWWSILSVWCKGLTYYTWIRRHHRPQAITPHNHPSNQPSNTKRKDSRLDVLKAEDRGAFQNAEPCQTRLVVHHHRLGGQGAGCGDWGGTIDQWIGVVGLVPHK